MVNLCSFPDARFEGGGREGAELNITGLYF